MGSGRGHERAAPGLITGEIKTGGSRKRGVGIRIERIDVVFVGFREDVARRMKAEIKIVRNMWGMVEVVVF